MVGKRFRKAIALAIVGFVSAGCGGNGASESPATFEPGFYRGDLNTFAWTNFPAGFAPLVAQVQSNGEFDAFFDFETTIGSLRNQPDDDLLLVSGRLILGKIEILDESDTGIQYLFRNKTGQILATGILAKTPFPSTTGPTNIPPVGVYTGELLIENERVPLALGRITVTIREEGNWVGYTPGISMGIGSAILRGQFIPDGTILDAFWSGGVGGVILQENARFSFDGETLVIHYPNLPLIPRQAWMTLKLD